MKNSKCIICFPCFNNNNFDVKVLAYILKLNKKNSMRQKVILIAIIVFTFFNVSAQGFKFGVKGGADVHKLSGASFKDQFSFGYHAGLFADIGLTSKFGIQPELYFSQVNLDTSNQFSTVYQFNNVSDVKLSYLNIPVLFNYYANSIVTLQAGPQYGILIDKNKNLLNNGKEAFKSGDFSMLAGLQLKISKIRLYGRYVVGLNNINDIDNREKWKNQTVHVGLGLNL